MKNGESGFTLLEMLAATALAAILLIALLAVTASLGRNAAHMKKADRRQTWSDGLVPLLQLDLANATSLRIETNSFILEGHGEIDLAEATPTQCLATITYSLRRVGDHTWLVREQCARNPLEPSKRSVDFVCADVRAISLARVEGGQKATQLPMNGNSIPSAVRLVVHPEDPLLPRLDQWLVLR